jgi:hypothetical protein
MGAIGLRDARRGTSPEVPGLRRLSLSRIRFPSQSQSPCVCKTDEPRGGDVAVRVRLPAQALQFSCQMWVGVPQPVDFLLDVSKLSPHGEFGGFEHQATAFIEFQQSCTWVQMVTPFRSEL